MTKFEGNSWFDCKTSDSKKIEEKMFVARDRTTGTFHDFLTPGKSNPQARTTELQDASVIDKLTDF